MPKVNNFRLLSRSLCLELYIVLLFAIQYGIIHTRKESVYYGNKKCKCNGSVCSQEIKRQAEAVLDKLGLPVSVLIDTLYRQIIMTGGVPYSLTVPSLPARDSMTDEQFNIMMEKGYHQAKTGEDCLLTEAFTKIREGI